MAKEEYLIGEFPQDENEYDPFSISPTFVKIIQTMIKMKIKKARIAIVGRLYTGGRFISGFSKILDLTSIQNAARESGSYEQKWQNLMNMNQKPIHITGVSIRPI